MYFRTLWVSLMLLCCWQSSPVQATIHSSLLSLQPNKCVALHKGRTCFAEVTIRWQAPGVGDYCLYEQGVSNAIACWNNVSQGAMNYYFESNKNALFLLKSKQGAHHLAEAKIVVSWLHKSPDKRRRWRLF